MNSPHLGQTKCVASSDNVRAFPSSIGVLQTGHWAKVISLEVVRQRDRSKPGYPILAMFSASTPIGYACCLAVPQNLTLPFLRCDVGELASKLLVLSGRDDQVLTDLVLIAVHGIDD